VILPEEKFSESTVVLVHGLWMPGWVMVLLGLRLKRCGFRTVIFSYPSMSNSLSQNAHILSDFVAGIASSHIHFVGHSLGGLLIMQMLSGILTSELNVSYWQVVLVRPAI